MGVKLYMAHVLVREGGMVGPMASAAYFLIHDSNTLILQRFGKTVCVISTKQAARFQFVNYHCLLSIPGDTALLRISPTPRPWGHKKILAPWLLQYSQPSFRALDRKDSSTRATVRMFIKCSELLRWRQTIPHVGTLYTVQSKFFK